MSDLILVSGLPGQPPVVLPALTGDEELTGARTWVASMAGAGWMASILT